MLTREDKPFSIIILSIHLARLILSCRVVQESMKLKKPSQFPGHYTDNWKPANYDPN